MGIAGGFVAFVIIWMLCFFLALPWGIQNHIESGQEIVAGADPAAPVRPRLLLKAGITTVIAGILWGTLYVVIEYRLIGLDDFPF